MIDLEVEEEVEEILMDDEDIKVEVQVIEIEGLNPISKLPEYIPPCRCKTKVPKDINESHLEHTPLAAQNHI